MKIYFSDFFDVSEDLLDEYGAFNISLITDLPLFIDPFLLFNGEKAEYQTLHSNMIEYLRFLKTKSEGRNISSALMKAWYCFGEVRQNWLGFCQTQNSGRGLGPGFARALDENLVHVFQNFGNENITKGSHLEKLCLIRSGVGRDMISDFTTNLIKGYLLEYTSSFATKHLKADLIKPVSVQRALMNYEKQRWMPKTFHLPFYNGDYVLLTPKDILTKDETWINHGDMIRRYDEIPTAIENEQLRAEINNYFLQVIPQNKKLTQEEHNSAVSSIFVKYPQLIDYYIKQKEDSGDEAIASSSLKVQESGLLYVKQFGGLADLLHAQSGFYEIPGDTEIETREKIEFFKDVIENKGGYKIFYNSAGEPIRSEKDIHILFRLVWHKSPSDVSREVNDGGGPADYKISRGAADKTLIEFKLASNTQLKRNLQKQLDIYKSASNAKAGFKVVLYYTPEELERVTEILKTLGMQSDPNVFLVDARSDNKPTGSKA